MDDPVGYLPDDLAVLVPSIKEIRYRVGLSNDIWRYGDS